nr:MAG TPA: hypothetical protein [Caudoviricetes sp.]
MYLDTNISLTPGLFTKAPSGIEPHSLSCFMVRHRLL